jgi:hypothetical protein
MKKIILTLAILTILISCDTSKSPEVSYEKIHNCLPIPDDVPHTFKSGTPIKWDCEMAAFYKNGDLILHYDNDSGLVMIQKVR